MELSDLLWLDTRTSTIIDVKCKNCQLFCRTRWTQHRRKTLKKLTKNGLRGFRFLWKLLTVCLLYIFYRCLVTVRRNRHIRIPSGQCGQSTLLRRNTNELKNFHTTMKRRKRNRFNPYNVLDGPFANKTFHNMFNGQWRTFNGQNNSTGTEKRFGSHYTRNACACTRHFLGDGPLSLLLLPNGIRVGANAIRRTAKVVVARPCDNQIFFVWRQRADSCLLPVRQ